MSDEKKPKIEFTKEELKIILVAFKTCLLMNKISPVFYEDEMATVQTIVDKLSHATFEESALDFWGGKIVIKA